MEKANILVVDDDKEIAELVGIHLREEGYEVYKAYSGKEALEIFKQERIDLVILDFTRAISSIGRNGFGT